MTTFHVPTFGMNQNPESLQARIEGCRDVYGYEHDDVAVLLAEGPFWLWGDEDLRFVSHPDDQLVELKFVNSFAPYAFATVKVRNARAWAYEFQQGGQWKLFHTRVISD